MNKDKEIKDLQCSPFPLPPQRYGGGRERLPIDAKIKPVHGRTTVFSLPHACLATGLIGGEVPQGQSINWQVLTAMVEKKWNHSVDRFFEDVKRLGFKKENFENGKFNYKGAIIGWSGLQARLTPAKLKDLVVCPDLDLTMTIVSRRIGDIFIAAREPNFSWETLFGSSFAIDEDLGSFPDLLSEPWDRFKWF